jgi:lysozyme
MIEDVVLSVLIPFIQSFESCELPPYLDSRGIPTIGWGCRFLADGTPVTMGMAPLTQPQADALLETFAARYILIVDSTITVPLNPNQVAALSDFAYNAGGPAFRGSTLVREINKGLPNAANDLLSWDHETIDGKLEVSAGLLRRCEARLSLYNTRYVSVASNKQMKG